MDKTVITQFSDPMMGLSWECEPAIRQIEEEFGDVVEIRDCMGVLMRDVGDLMTPEERALPEAEGVERYIRERTEGTLRNRETRVRYGQRTSVDEKQRRLSSVSGAASRVS